MGKYVDNVHGRQKVEYVHKAQQVMQTTREIKLKGGDTIPEGALVYIYSRRQGYNCVALKPAFYQPLKFKIVNHSDLEEITISEWIRILNDEGNP